MADVAGGESASAHAKFLAALGSGGDFDVHPAVEDVNGLEIDNFKAQVADGVKASVLTDNVSGIVIRNAPVLEK